MHSKITTLDNGLRVLTCERPETETVSLGVWVNTGSAYETKEINLLNHETNYITLLNGDDNSVAKVKLSELTRGKITVSDTFDANAQVGDFIFKEV